MRSTVSWSNKPITSRTLTVLPIAPTGISWPVWAAPSCPVEAFYATSSFTSKGTLDTFLDTRHHSQHSYGHSLQVVETSSSLCVYLGVFRIKELFPGTEIEMFAHFIGESLKKTKTREFVPSQEEIVALLTRQEMTTTVYCHGGGSCKISINSHTTAGEVMSWSHCYIGYFKCFSATYDYFLFTDIFL